MRWKLIILHNPCAGGGRSATRFKKLLSLLDSNYIPWELLNCLEEETWQQLAERTFSRNTLLVIAGGDGSIHQTVNWFYQSDLPPDEWPAMTVFPIGSGNDWAGTHKIPSNPKKWIKKVLSGRITSGKLGKVEIATEGADDSSEVLKVNSLGIALTGQIAESLNDSRAGNNKQAQYLLLALKHYFKYTYPQFNCRINRTIIRSRPLSINIGLNETTGGGMRLFPQDEEDGQLKCTIVEKPAGIAIPRLIWKLYLGDISTAKKEVNCFCFEKMSIEGEQDEFPVEIDGEYYRSVKLKAEVENSVGWKIVKPV